MALAFTAHGLKREPRWSEVHQHFLSDLELGLVPEKAWFWKCAGFGLQEGMSAPMGAWIMTPRTRFAEDLLREHYSLGCRQLVVLGAGMDSRAFRMPLPELAVFEVDMQTTFDVKEPLLEGEKLTVKSRTVVATEFAEHGSCVLCFSIFRPQMWPSFMTG